MFGVSRVPVRDALQILINMGLAVNIPRRGVFVRRLSKKIWGKLREGMDIAVELGTEKIGEILAKDGDVAETFNFLSEKLMPWKH